MARRHAMLRVRLREYGYDQQGLRREFDKAGRSRSDKYISERMVGKYPWVLDEVYFIAGILDIPDEEIALYFPREGRDIMDIVKYREKKQRELDAQQLIQQIQVQIYMQLL